MGFGLARRARSRKAKGGLRALLGRAPDAKEVGDRLVRIARRMLGEAVVDATAKRVTLELHPAAGPVRIVVMPDGDLQISGETSVVGPGYHADIVARIAPVLEELDFVWAEDEPDPRTAMTAWLANELATGTTRIGIPAELDFQITAAVLTPMGPRDRAWCDAVIADPERGADAFAWWDDGPGQFERSCALLAMSLEVPWREPVDGDERALMVKVDKDLKAARKAAKSLDLPFAEWAELLGHLGEEERATEVRARAGDRTAVLGYRRHPMKVSLDAGWTLELPGAFVGSWEDDRYWATDGDRLVEVTCVSTNADHDSATLLDVAPEQHPVIERITEHDRRGRAEAYDEGEVHIVHGLMASAPEVAIVTCKGKLTDEAWALATWRSLRRS
ncbi:MAG: hypothetical protein ABI175_26105 [Polyangiales bacterium]